jgi:hypothetical protein
MSSCSNIDKIQYIRVQCIIIYILTDFTLFIPESFKSSSISHNLLIRSSREMLRL